VSDAWDEYGGVAIPSECSVLRNLMSASNRETGKRLSDIEISAQALVFLLAGGRACGR
jgi:cytochrome P450